MIPEGHRRLVQIFPGLKAVTWYFFSAEAHVSIYSQYGLHCLCQQGCKTVDLEPEAYLKQPLVSPPLPNK